MTRKAFWSFAVAGCFAVAVGCGSSDGPGSTDGSAPRADGSKPQLDGGITIPDEDSGVVPKPDQGTSPAGSTCVEIMACMDACGQDEACINACIGKGTAEAKQQITALLQCYSTQIQGACQVPCADQTSNECQSCVLDACKAQTEACLGTGGPATAGFGDACSPSAPACPAPLACITLDGVKGFCTKKCTNQGLPCDGAPEGTMAACLLSSPDSPDLFCAFICAGGGQTFECPSALTCGDENPPGSGQKPCVP